MVDALLHDTAAVLVAGYFDALGAHFIENKLGVVWLPAFEYFLDHVVSVNIPAQLLDNRSEIALEHVEVLLLRDDLYQLLN